MEGNYAFSLSDTALLDSKLVSGQEISNSELEDFKQLSNDDKIYNQILNYLAIRQRSKWEIESYLKRKAVSPALVDIILNKLSINKLINDEKFARAWVNDRLLLRPTSSRKLILELKQKHVKEEVIQIVMQDIEPEVETSTLRAMVASKRKQSKYQDDLKLMQYLARQGFNYGDIKAVLSEEAE